MADLLIDRGSHDKVKSSKSKLKEGKIDLSESERLKSLKHNMKKSDL